MLHVPQGVLGIDRAAIVRVGCALISGGGHLGGGHRTPVVVSVHLGLDNVRRVRRVLGAHPLVVHAVVVGGDGEEDGEYDDGDDAFHREGGGGVGRLSHLHNLGQAVVTAEVSVGGQAEL